MTTSHGSRLSILVLRALIGATVLAFSIAAPVLADSHEGSMLDVSACDADTQARLRWMTDRLDSRERYADLWWRGWISFYGIGTVVQATRAGLEDDGGERADLIVSAVKAAGGTTRLFFARPVARLGADPLRA